MTDWMWCYECPKEAAAEIDQLRLVLKGYEAWEAKLVLDNKWTGVNGMPTLTQADYDSLIELQTQRNAVLKGETK